MVAVYLVVVVVVVVVVVFVEYHGVSFFELQKEGEVTPHSENIV